MNMRTVKIAAAVAVFIGCCALHAAGQTKKYPYTVADGSSFTLPGGAGADMGPVIVSRDSEGGVRKAALMSISDFPTETNTNMTFTTWNRVAPKMQVAKQDVKDNGELYPQTANSVADFTRVKWRDSGCTTYPAKEACAAMNSQPGYGTGWRLPSLSEIHVIYAVGGMEAHQYPGLTGPSPLTEDAKTLYNLSISQFNPLATPGSGIYYATGTEYNQYYAWYVICGEGIMPHHTAYLKTENLFNVRCVREVE